MCNKAVDNYPHTLEFVPDCYITQKMCDKAVHTHPSVIEYVIIEYNECFLYFIRYLIGIKLKKCVT